MVKLESAGFLKKEHHSSGRIPTKKGYYTYIELLMKEQKITDNVLQEKLFAIFSDRNDSIDITIDKSAGLISNFLNLPIIVTKFNDSNNELLKKIDIVKITENQYLVYIITSLGEMYNNKITINEFKERDDIDICLKLLNEKLVDTPINQISKKILEIIPQLKEKVHQYEFVYINIISKLIKSVTKNSESVSKMYNGNFLIKQPEVINKQIDLNDIFHLLENYSTFSQINYNYLKTGNTFINLDSDIEGLSIASTIINSQENKHKLSIVGPTRMNYALVKYLLEFINEKLVNKK